MNSKSNKPAISGLRPPTAEEKAGIAQHLGWCFKRTYVPTSGKVFCYIGVFFLVCSIANCLRGFAYLATSVVLLIPGAVCFGFYRLNKHSDNTFRNRIEAVKNGSYFVAPAEIVKVYGKDEHCVFGIVELKLSDGSLLPDCYSTPYEPMFQNKRQGWPVLAVHIPEDSTVYAVPVEQLEHS